MAAKNSHKIEMRKIYRYKPPSVSELEARKRTGRLSKFVPLFNRYLRKGTVVDLGCGFGLYTKEIHGRTVVGLDFSQEGLRIAQTYAPRAHYVLADMEHLPFRNASVDSFFSYCSVYCLKPLPRGNLFREIYRVLRPGGNIILVEPNWLNPFREREPKYPLYHPHVRTQLKTTGFAEISIRFVNFIPRPILVRGGPILEMLEFFEWVLETLRVPISGGLLISAEKPRL